MRLTLQSWAFSIAAVTWLWFGSPRILLADFPLVGLDPRSDSVADGDFTVVKSNKRELKPSPFWTTRDLGGAKNPYIGIDEGRMVSAVRTIAQIDSRVLDQCADYPRPVAGDRLAWEFAARAEYQCDAFVSLFLVFENGEEETVRTLADKKRLPTGPEAPAIFAGAYTLTAADAALGMPRLRFHSQGSDSVRVYLEHVDLRVVNRQTAGPAGLAVTSIPSGAQIKWTAVDRDVDDKNDDADVRYTVFRSVDRRGPYQRIATGIKDASFIDQESVAGITYFYSVTSKVGKSESSAAPLVTFRAVDQIAPAPPEFTQVKGHDAEVSLRWESSDDDVKSYSLYRVDADGANKRAIVHDLTKTNFVDYMPAKGKWNHYQVVALDHSGNASAASKIGKVKVKSVPGASFRDLIQPIPIISQISTVLGNRRYRKWVSRRDFSH